MKPQDYIFNVGDEVITVEGEKGTITRICDCSECRKRGFLEPLWKNENGDVLCISHYDAVEDFYAYYKIGDYHFNPFNKNRVIEAIKGHESYLSDLRKQLKTIEELEKKETVEEFDRPTALNILRDLSKNMYPNYDIFGKKTLVINRDRFEAVRKKYLDKE